MKEFKILDEQIEILKSRKLLFNNEEDAKTKLMRYGYYEIVNGYKDFLLKNNNEFNDHETFEHLFALFELDRELSKFVLASTLLFELNLKTALSYYISQK